MGHYLFFNPLCCTCFNWFWVSLPVCAIVIAWSNEDSSGEMGMVALAFVIMAWIVWRHRSNIIRLREGTENRFQKKNKI